MIYAAVFIMIVYAQFINILTGLKYKNFGKAFFIIIAFIMLFIAAFRDGIGYDYQNYEKIYNLIHYYNADWAMVNIELGYYILIKLCTSYNMLVVVSTSITVTLKLIFIDKYSKDKLLSLLLYFSGVFIMFDMGVIRQGLSIGIALYSLKYIKERSFLKFFLIILIAAQFHISSLVFIPLYFLGKKSFSRKFYYGISFFVLIISFIDITNLIINISTHIPIHIIQSKLIYYSTLYTGDVTASLLKRIAFLIIFVEAYKRLRIDDPESYIFLNGYFLSIVFLGLFSSIDILGGRGSIGIYFLQIFIFPIIIERVSHPIVRMLIFIIVISLSIYSLMGPINEGEILNQPYVPYRNILIN